MLTALKDFKHPGTGKMVREGERVELNREQESLYRRLSAVRHAVSKAASKKRATAKK